MQGGISEIAALLPPMTEKQRALEALEAARIKAETAVYQKAAESVLDLERGNIIDPLDALRDPETGRLWTEVGSEDIVGETASPVMTETSQEKTKALENK